MPEPPIVFPDTPKATPIRVVDIDLPIGSMIAFLLKLAFAAIPALLVLGMLGALIGGLLGLA